jgi:DNA-binding CsgD family transcriptional regulator
VTAVTVGDTTSVLAAARAAIDRCDWQAAEHLLGGLVGADGLVEAERLDLLGEVQWWLGRLDGCIAAREQAYARFDEIGEQRRAGQVAVWLYEHHCFKGRPAIGSGWLGRARRALDGDRECVEYGNLLLREAESAHGRGDLEAAAERAAAARSLGVRLRSEDLEAEALQTMGRIAIDRGAPAEGLAFLDEAMLFAVEGRLGPYATGKVYCSLVGACEDLGDLRRAAEWTEATARWSEQHPFAVFPGLCRVKRAEVLQWRGAWREAEAEARRACDELADIKVASAAAAWSEIGEIRRRIGDLEGAEAAFARAQELCCVPSDGLALLRLAQGRVSAARAIVDGALADEARKPLARARLLPAKVQAALAAGDLAEARAAADELDEIAAHYGTPAITASSLTTRGRCQLASGDGRAAGATLRRAVEQWRSLDVPYEAAAAQVLLGRACREVGDHDGAAQALRAAAATFDALGAEHGVGELLRAAERRTFPCGLTAREVEVLRLIASGQTNKEVAAALGLSQKTVARHVSNIFAKTGLETRSAATAFAFRSGLVEAGPRA